MEVKLSLSTTCDKASDPVAHALQEICASRDINRDCWFVSASSDGLWLCFRHTRVSLPEQGWKLHISADRASAVAFLHRTLPLLLSEEIHFKVAASLEYLDHLNRGEGGSGQVGKFITIYPPTDQEAVSLAARLDEVTSDLSGPKIPTDRPLRTGSMVHYRYGSFQHGLYTQLLSGKILPVVKTPQGELVPDLRLPRYQAPAWIKDPFLAAGLAADFPEMPRQIGGRYLIVTMIAASINHILYLAADLEVPRSCVIKGPGYAWQHRPEAHARLRHEAEILARLGPDPHIPAFYSLVEQENNLFLVMQDIEGETLDSWMAKKRSRGHCSFSQAITWTLEVIRILKNIHAKGFVYADVKSSNIIIGSQGELYLIDFEHTHEKDAKYASGGGTPGYMSPQRRSGQAATIQDDIYGCGALLYFLVTSVEPSVAPNPGMLLTRPIDLLRPDIDASLQRLIECALHPDPAVRYSSMNEFETALLAIGKDRTFCQVQREENALFTHDREERNSAHYRTLAAKLLITLCAVAKEQVRNEGLAWESYSHAGQLTCRDIYIGSGGVVLALTDLATALEDATALTVLARGAAWLRQAPPINQPPLPGLYIGEAGVGAVLLRAGQALKDRALLREAVEYGRRVASLAYASPDLITGAAGRLRFHLFLWDETSEEEHLRMAIACGEYLLQTAQTNHHQEVFWKIPDGYGNLSNHAYLGYGHGAAGIADALLDLFKVTGDERFLSAIQGAGRWLQRRAISTLADDSGLNWPITGESTEVANPFWCHGAAGIGRFFLNASLHDVIPGARELAERAARTVAYAARWLGPTQCHGLAGSIEFLLDMYQATNTSSYYEQALAHGRLLEAFAAELNGLYVFPAELRTIFTPDYMLGNAGIAIGLLRLSTAGRLPHQLSRAGFRWHEQCGQQSSPAIKVQ